MSVICTAVEDSPLVRKATYIGASKFVNATIDPTSVTESPLPANYKYGKCFLPRKYTQMAERLHNTKVRPDDIWVVSFPKCGTTWTQNIVWQLQNGLNFEAPPIDYLYQMLDLPVWLENSDELDESQKNLTQLFDDGFNEFDKVLSPRLCKSHLPAYMLPKEMWTVRPKIIYITRNPKDVAVSMFHFYRNIFVDYSTSFEDFLDAFHNDHVNFGPFHDHLLSFWQLRHLDHVLFLTYEELLNDQFGGVKRISEFLECSYNDKELRELTEYVSFDNMKEKLPTIAASELVIPEPGYRFCRKGKAGGYEDEMSDEWIQRFDKWTADRLKDSEFKFAI